MKCTASTKDSGVHRCRGGGGGGGGHHGGRDLRTTVPATGSGMLPEPLVPHKCDINGLGLICGSSKCRSCKVQSVYKRTAPWFHTATMQEQSDALFQSVKLCHPSFQRQVQTILKPLMRKGMNYSFELTEQRPQMLHREAKAEAKLRAAGARPLTSSGNGGAAVSASKLAPPPTIPSEAPKALQLGLSGSLSPTKKRGGVGVTTRKGKLSGKAGDVQGMIDDGTQALSEWFGSADELSRVFLFQKLLALVGHSPMRALYDKLQTS
eukprot:gene12425-31176_t